jgi:hypothetical protein
VKHSATTCNPFPHVLIVSSERSLLVDDFRPRHTVMLVQKIAVETAVALSCWLLCCCNSCCALTVVCCSVMLCFTGLGPLLDCVVVCGFCVVRCCPMLTDSVLYDLLCACALCCRKFRLNGVFVVIVDVFSF